MYIYIYILELKARQGGPATCRQAIINTSCRRVLAHGAHEPYSPGHPKLRLYKLYMLLCVCKDGDETKTNNRNCPTNTLVRPWRTPARTKTPGPLGPIYDKGPLRRAHQTIVHIRMHVRNETTSTIRSIMTWAPLVESLPTLSPRSPEEEE